jgi:hypothetical protein
MEGCPLSKNKFEGACVTCAQVNDCVFLGLAKNIDDIKTYLRDIERNIKKLSEEKK